MARAVLADQDRGEAGSEAARLRDRRDDGRAALALDEGPQVRRQEGPLQPPGGLAVRGGVGRDGRGGAWRASFPTRTPSWARTGYRGGARAGPTRSRTGRRARARPADHRPSASRSWRRWTSSSPRAPSSARRPRGSTTTRPGWQDPAAFAVFVEAVRADAAPRDAAPGLARAVHDAVVGRRRGLPRPASRSATSSTTSSSTSAGTSATTYAPTRRREGHATAMLRARPAVGPRPGDRPRPGHLRRRQPRLDPRDRGRRRRARGRPRREAALLGADRVLSRLPLEAWTARRTPGARGGTDADHRDHEPDELGGRSVSSSTSHASTAVTGGLRKNRLAAAPEPPRRTRSDEQDQADDRVDDRQEQHGDHRLRGVGDRPRRPRWSSRARAAGERTRRTATAADHSRSGCAPIQRWPRVPRLRVSMLRQPISTATGPPAWPRSAPSTSSTPTTPTTKPATWSAETRSPRSAGRQQGGEHRAERVEERGEGGAEAEVEGDVHQAELERRSSPGRPRPPGRACARSIRVGRLSARARPAPRSAARTKRQPSTENGAAACTAAGPEM